MNIIDHSTKNNKFDGPSLYLATFYFYLSNLK
jgi:hypothetical protein